MQIVQKHSLVCIASILCASKLALAQQPPISTDLSPQTQPIHANGCAATETDQRENQANQLAVSQHFASAIERCDREPTLPACQVAVCLSSNTAVAGDAATVRVALADFLRLGVPATSADERASESLLVESSRPLTESVDTIASATAIFSVFTQGVASFLITRARLEMQRTALERLQTNVCGLSSTLLSNTCAFLGDQGRANPSTSSAESTANTLEQAASSFGAGLQTAFQRDVLALPQWALSNATFSTTSETAAAQRLALRLMAALMQLSDPLPVASALVDESERLAASTVNLVPLNKALKAFRVVMLATLASSGSGVPVSLGSRAQMVRWLVSSALNVAVPSEQLAACMAIARASWDAQRAAQELANPSLGDSQRRQRIATLALNFVTALRSTIELARTTMPTWPAISMLSNNLMATLAVFEAMSTGDIARVFSSMVGSFRLLGAGQSLVPTEYRRALSWLSAGAEFASARTPQQIEAAIAAFAAPPGSWQAKLDQPGVWVNGFVGVFGGGEQLFNGHSSNQLGPLIAPHLSVGIDFTRPALNHQIAIGLYIPVLDLGALANASGATLSSNSGASMGMMLPVRVSPGQFLAPGLYGRLTLGRSPLVLSAGLSVLPFGREVEVSPMVFENASSFRFGASLSADIPILPMTF